MKRAAIYVRVSTTNRVRGGARGPCAWGGRRVGAWDRPSMFLRLDLASAWRWRLERRTRVRSARADRFRASALPLPPARSAGVPLNSVVRALPGASTPVPWPGARRSARGGGRFLTSGLAGGTFIFGPLGGALVHHSDRSELRSPPERFLHYFNQFLRFQCWPARSAGLSALTATATNRRWQPSAHCALDAGRAGAGPARGT